MEFQTEPEENVSGRQIPIPRGKSSGWIEFYKWHAIRSGQAFDYNVWAQLGNRGGPMRMYSLISKNRETLNVDQIILGVKAGFLTSQICTNVMT